MKRGAIEQLILLGDKAASANLVPIVRHKAIEFAKQVLPGACLAKRMVFPNGWARIQVREGRRRLVIYTETGGASYEFFTSELIDKDSMGTPPYDGGAFGTSVCGKGSFHEFVAGNVESTPLVNLCHNCLDTLPGEDPEEPWPEENCATNVGLQFMNTPDIWDYKKCHLQVWFRNNGGRQFVVSQADVNPYYSRRCLQSRFNGSFLFRDFQFVSDRGDPPLVYKATETEPVAYGAPDPITDRKRRKAALLDADGTTLVVNVDNKGTWYAWEAGKYDDAGDIPRVETVTPSYDVRIQDALGTFNFNSNGTKAVAVALERFTTPGRNGDPDLDKAIVGEIEDQEYSFGWDNNSAPNGTQKAKEDSPVLVEVQLIAGKDQFGDWTFDVNIIREDRYADNGVWFMAADYLIKDDRLPYPEDTLVVLAFEMQYDTGIPHGYWDGSGTYFPDDVEAKIETRVGTKAWDQGDWQDIAYYNMYNNVRVRRGTISPFTDPFGNIAETWEAAQVDNITNYLPLYSGVIRSMNLRTLSFLFLNEELRNNTTSSANNARSFQSKVIAYNQLYNVERYNDTSQGTPTFEPTWGVTNRLPVPADHYALLAIFAENHHQSEWIGQFNWHPKGHWSVCLNNYPLETYNVDNWQVDLIVFRRSGGDDLYLHKDLYNATFNDNRSHTFYDNSTAYRGVFRTAGLWRDQ